MGGELFVPKIPSYRITDLAKAVAPECKQEIVGIRPGEKLHEEMITNTDAMNSIEFPDYYVVMPSATPKWNVESFLKESNSITGSMVESEFSYNSGNNPQFLSVDELQNF